MSDRCDSGRAWVEANRAYDEAARAWRNCACGKPGCVFEAEEAES